MTESQLILVTGASSGIGRSIAIRMSQQGVQLALLARRINELELTAELCRRSGARKVECFAYDLKNYNGINKLIENIEGQFGTSVQTLFHAAGQQVFGCLEKIPLTTIERCLDVNVMSFLALVQATIPGMRNLGKGTFAIVSSSVAYWGPPGFSVYSASKASVEWIAECIRYELREDNIGVIVISPGAVDTPMFWNPQTFGDPPRPPVTKPQDADDVAHEIVSAVSRGRERVVISWRGKILHHLSYWSPRLLRIIYHQLSRRQKRPQTYSKG